MIDKIIIGNNEIEKHNKYKKYYKKDTLYWGLGIENELYLEFEKKASISKDFFFKNHKRERYSVDYFSNYKQIYFYEALIMYIRNKELENNRTFILPLLLNSHSFLKTDNNNNPKTKYTKNCEINPEFNGKTLIEFLLDNNEYFKNTINNEWLFDGDTIEFTTLNFYNAKLSNIINEIQKYKKEFIQNLNKSFEEIEYFKKYGSIKFMEYNHPFSIYMTNLNNISMFNNGTLHYNITLPTQLNENSEIKNINKFIDDHKKGIKIIQWFEPFLIAIYGANDIFSNIENYENKNKFSKSSQRCAISRYIGIGTYNTDNMNPGKILTIPIELLDFSKNDYWWYNTYYKDNAYERLTEIGLDINFNKHYNHGIEIRFLDHLCDDNKLFKSFEFIIYLMDYILESEYINNFENPIINKIWNKFIVNILKYGKDYILNSEEIELYEKILNIKLTKNVLEDIYNEIYFHFIIKFNKFYKSVENNSKDYVLIPIGSYSSLTLDTQYINMDLLNDYDINSLNIENLHLTLENKVNKEDKILQVIHEKCCAIC